MDTVLEGDSGTIKHTGCRERETRLLSAFVHGHPKHLSFEHQVSINPSLKIELSQTARHDARDFCNQIQSSSRIDGLSKADFVHAAESKIVTTDQIILASIEATKLCGGFTLYDSGHQRKTGHVTTDPEFIV